jgi:deoxyribodipyrimidine photolyase-related protein
MRDLYLILGDQLDVDGPFLASLDPEHDVAALIEAPGEASLVWSHKQRIALFLSAMRHTRDTLRARGVTVAHVAVDEDGPPGLPDRLRGLLRQLRPARVRVIEPGEYRLDLAIREVCAQEAVALDVVEDPHFLCSKAEFQAWASKYKGELRMEFFYREMRRRHRVLLDEAGEPEGGRWNYDVDNREGYPRTGPGRVPPPARFEPDAVTAEVLALVAARFPDHPGSLASFGWPVTRAQALAALDRFVSTRLASFGPYQDAMWEGQPFGWHSLLSPALNLHLLDPREVIDAAVQAYRDGRAPLASVEGFVRQILGWREFIRGVYWRDMPAMAEANHFGHFRRLPRWYWTGETSMACARDAVGQTLRFGYAHHIQRLMVTGLFALLAEVDPKAVAAWYLAVYVDAVDWVELPNVAGMALYADGGRFTSKPYVASGAYIDRMSNHCAGCRYAVDEKRAEKTGQPLCPFTALYWAFLDRHEAALLANGRTSLMAKNIGRRTVEERRRIRERAATLLERVDEL